MIYSVDHVTRLKYAAPVKQAQFNVRLVPWAFPSQKLLRMSLVCNPAPDQHDERAGPYCVNTTQIAFDNPLSELTITSRFAIDIAPVPTPADGPTSAETMRQALAARDVSASAPAPFLFASRIADIDSTIGRWAGEHLLSQAGIVESANSLMSAIFLQFDYVPGATTSATPPAEAFAARKGVCQDFAHIMIVALRSHGIPAAYVSGYLRTVPPPGEARLVGADAMHAWVAVWCGQELGWIGFDPTNNCLAGPNHIVIAIGRDYADVAPIDGRFIGSAPQSMTTAVDVIESA